MKLLCTFVTRMIRNREEYEDLETLILKFNKREKSAFSKLYVQIFDEVDHFAENLFYNTTIDSEDLIQDIFVAIWCNSKIQFLSLEHIRNYIYLGIKNRHKDYLRHKVTSNNYIEQIKNIEEYHSNQIIESETISLLSIAEDILPEECAKVLKLYIEGYEVKEISEKLGKSQFTVYHQRSEAVTVIKKHINLKKITFISLFFTSI